MNYGIWAQIQCVVFTSARKRSLLDRSIEIDHAECKSLEIHQILDILCMHACMSYISHDEDTPEIS